MGNIVVGACEEVTWIVYASTAEVTPKGAKTLSLGSAVEKDIQVTLVIQSPALYQEYIVNEGIVGFLKQEQLNLEVGIEQLKFGGDDEFLECS